MKSFSFVSVLGFLTFGFVLASCSVQDEFDKRIDSYMERKGVDKVENALNEIVKRRQAEARREPTLAERMKDRVEVSFDGAPVKGDKNAPITIVEFSAYECPFCSRVIPTINRILEEYKGKVKVAFRHNPLREESLPAHKAAMAAQEQGKFWEYSDLMFKNQRALTEENLIKWARDLKLDVEKFKKDMKKPTYVERITSDQNFARSTGAGGTPSFFINGVKVVGAQPYENFKEVIDALLAEKS
jgi:protein-disulfide isomerase